MGSRSEAVRVFMEHFGQKVREVPTSDIPENEQILRAKLVLSEAFEFCEAMGVHIYSIGTTKNDEMDEMEVTQDNIVYTAAHEIDLVDAADAVCDLLVVVYGSAWTLGIGDALGDLFDEVHRSNMDKIDPITNEIKHDEHGKVLKPEGWTKPDLASILERAMKTECNFDGCTMSSEHVHPSI